VLDDGQTLEIRDLVGFAEEHRRRCAILQNRASAGQAAYSAAMAASALFADPLVRHAH
jgi:hypothetical protein